jgi:hypothetical protein
MTSSTKSLAAIEQVNELLHQICPAMKGAGRRKRRGIPDVEQALLLPLFLECIGGNQFELRMKRGRHSTLLSMDNYKRVPAGSYRIHVFDTIIECSAAVQSLESFGLGYDLSCFELESGEGGIFVHLDAKAEEPENTDVLDSECKLHFTGANGAVQIMILDHRADPAAMDVAMKTKPIFTSLSYPSHTVISVLHEYENRHKCNSPHSGSVERGRFIANLVKNACRDTQSIRACQLCLEKIPGALVSLGAISVDMVKDQLEDMLSGLENDMSGPEDDDLHDLILKVSSQSLADHDQIARDVVWKAFHNNMLNPL